jgi:large conductance mechanosensitive channel
MSMISEFMEFLKKYQVLGLAVAFIIGGAASKLVTAMVNDLIMPIVGLLVPGGDWRTFAISLTNEVGKNELKIGDFVGAVIDFVIIAAVVFTVVKFIMKEKEPTKKV